MEDGRTVPPIRDLMTVPRSCHTVAVVDDDPAILRSLEDLLESADYAVHACLSGPALLQSGRLGDISCVISDVDMPGMDGFELLRLIHEARPGLPAVLITGYPETLPRLDHPGGGTPPVLTKPFDGRDLLAAVERALGNPRT